MQKVFNAIGWTFFALAWVFAYIAAALIAYWMVWLVLLCALLCGIFCGIAQAMKEKKLEEDQADIIVDAESGEVYTPKGHQGTVKFR